ncbi:hypothetical protein RRG08_001439 [Elysia crispata]|uniref:Uncharacterized protein n=1 Tax=Elysia crispata TaxID=231223 RepID=A0AAE0ZQR9_9GAST|nr:hypothetical protein RRG08_001439 [Elysia crispata]
MKLRNESEMAISKEMSLNDHGLNPKHAGAIKRKTPQSISMHDLYQMVTGASVRTVSCDRKDHLERFCNPKRLVPRD